MRLQIEEAVYYLFTWTSGTFNFEAGVRPEREDFLVRISPECAAARRRAAGGRVEPDREEDPLLRPDLLGGSGSTSASRRPTLSAEQQRLLPLIDGTRDVQAGHRRVRAGRVRGREGAVRPDHRRVRPPGRDLDRGGARRSTTAGWRSTGTWASPSTRPAMLDEALREFRRVADLRPADSQRAVLSRAHRASGRRGGRRPPRPSAGGRRRACPGRRRCTTSALRSSSWAGWTRRRRRTATLRAAPGTTPASCWAGASSR